jgi:hypothetical protein
LIPVHFNLHVSLAELRLIAEESSERERAADAAAGLAPEVGRINDDLLGV